MRTVSPNVALLLGQNSVQTFYLFSIKGVGINLKYTTHFHDVTVTGLGTFKHENSIASFKPPIMERASNREAWKMGLADSNFELREIVELNLIGARAKFYMGLVNTMDYIVGGAEPGQPLLDIDDITLGFDGIIDTKDYTVNPLENVNLLNIECSTPMASLGMTRPYLTSRDALRHINAGDTSFDEVYNGSAGVTILWGKMPT